jgi:hypothetical protein
VAQLKPTTEGNTIVLAWKGFDLPERDVLLHPTRRGFTRPLGAARAKMGQAPVSPSSLRPRLR